MMNPFLQVALGGAIGATARYGVYRALIWHGPGLPIATVLVNVLGSFVMGFLAVCLSTRGTHPYAPLVMTGILGGFTTFSAYSLDALTLWERGQQNAALLYVVASVVLSLAAAALGLLVARSLFA